jgi:filamentous hemagglutinin
MTKEQEKYFYNKLHEGFWKIKTTTIEDNVETAVYNQIIGGVKVQATKGLTIELAQYENGSTQANGQNTESARISSDIKALKLQIISAKRFGQSTEALDAQVALLSEELLQAQFGELATADSSLAWMQDVYNDNQYQDNFNLAYQELIEIHKFDKTSTLSPAAMAIIAIAVAVAMGPAGLGAIGANGAIASFTLTPALQAGLLAVANQAAVGLASGHGLEDTTKSLFHSDNIKSTATAMVTAGVLDKLQGSFDYFPVTPESPLINAQSITNQATQILGNAVVRTGISTVIAGGDLGDFEEAFKRSLTQAGIDELGQYMASEIGLAWDVSKPEAFDTAMKYISHAGVGCIIGAATASINSSNTSSGCASGAGGAVIGEFVATEYRERTAEEVATSKVKIEELLASENAYVQTLIDNGMESEAIYKHLNSKSTIDYYQGEINNIRNAGVDIARLGAALSAFASGADASGINIAADTGENAAANNALFLLAIPIILKAIDVALTLNDLHTEYVSIEKAYEEGGSEAGDQAMADFLYNQAQEGALSLVLQKLIPGGTIAKKLSESEMLGIVKSWGGKATDNLMYAIEYSGQFAADTLDTLKDKIWKTKNNRNDGFKTSEEFNYANGIAFNLELKKHMAKPDGFTRYGVKGAHNKNEFDNIVESEGYKITGQKEVIPGVTEIKYQSPGYHPQRPTEITHYKTEQTKTVYDPSVYSDSQMLDWGQKAASTKYAAEVDIFKHSGNNSGKYNAIYEGVNFEVRLNLDKSGNVYIGSIYPQ